MLHARIVPTGILAWIVLLARIVPTGDNFYSPDLGMILARQKPCQLVCFLGTKVVGIKVVSQNLIPRILIPTAGIQFPGIKVVFRQISGIKFLGIKRLFLQFLGIKVVFTVQELKLYSGRK